LVDLAGPLVPGTVLPDAHHAPTLTVADYRAAQRSLGSTAGYTVRQIERVSELDHEFVDEKLVACDGAQRII
jgi:hypothetical protein